MKTDVQLAVLFADVAGSTQLYERFGDAAGQQLIGAAITLMQESTARYGGTVVKTMGDAVMATFPQANDAVAAADLMQRQLEDTTMVGADATRVAIRIGCHFGPVMLEAQDVFGSAVHTASRLTSQAKAGQIMITEDVVTRLSMDWRRKVRHVDVATLRGFQDEVELYEVIWHTNEITSVVHVPSSIFPGRARSRKMRIGVNGAEMSIGDEGQSIQLGRADSNELMVPGSLVSRLHARIEVSKLSFKFVDQSTNGSFIQPDGGEMTFIRRDSMRLEGSGTIGLGREPGDNDPGTIRYCCVE